MGWAVDIGFQFTTKHNKKNAVEMKYLCYVANALQWWIDLARF